MQVKNIINQLPKHPTKRYKQRMLSDVRQVVVHHSATTSGTPESFARYHVDTNKWPGIGYHYVIAKDGTVYKCQPATAISYHAAGANASGIGVCLVGHLDKQRPTEAQMASLMELLGDLITAYRIKPDRVVGHREVPGTKKTCPGSSVDMYEIRRRLRDG